MLHLYYSQFLTSLLFNMFIIPATSATPSSWNIAPNSDACKNNSANNKHRITVPPSAKLIKKLITFIIIFMTPFLIVLIVSHYQTIVNN